MTKTFFIPENIDLQWHVDRNPPNFSFNFDHAHYILHLIDEIKARNKDRYPDGTPLNSTILASYVDGYQRYLRYFQDCEVLLTDNIYIPGEKSRYYWFADKYQNIPLKPIEIDDCLLIKKLSDRHRNEDYKYINQQYGYLTKPFDRLQIDDVAAVEYLNKTYSKEDEAYKRGIIQINNFKEQNWNFSIGSTGRLYTSLTSLPRDLRNFLGYDGVALKEVDVCASQPYFLLALLDRKFWYSPSSSSSFSFRNVSEAAWKNLKAYKDGNNCNYYINDVIVKYINMLRNSLGRQYHGDIQDVRVYKELLEKGTFYEYLMTLYRMECHEKYSGRDVMKDDFFWIMNGKPDDIYLPKGNKQVNPIQLFAEIFPHIYGLLDILKVEDYRHVSWIVQGIESKIVLDYICGELANRYPKMPLFTIHDCIITTVDYVDTLQVWMKDEFEKYVGFPPILKTKILDPSMIK